MRSRRRAPSNGLIAHFLGTHRWGWIAMLVLWVAVISLPLVNWLLYLALIAVLGVMTIRWTIRNWRVPAREGHCAHCGYDLRATPDQCPECGTVPDVKVNAT